MNPIRLTLQIRARHTSLLAGFLALTVFVRADSVDDAVTAEMTKRKIHGLSLAVIQDGAIVKAKGYGSIDAEGSKPVTVDTLFQAGSVSKPVAAFGALYLVEKGKLTLDADVNGVLKAWHVPENEFTSAEKVTLRRLLSHSAGLTVHGFPGYAIDAAKPTVVQVLDGEKPANTAAIRVDMKPGSKWRYSGGGYTVMQHLVTEVSGQSFPEFMRVTVLEPLKMRASTYEQPVPADRAATTASGYLSATRPVAGRWHVYPEMAAAGLWTTPSDLARFAIAVQDNLAGRATLVISQSLTREMLTRQSENFGLGVGLAENGKTQRFEHGGRDAGFDAQLTAYAETRQGAVIMINANENTGAIRRIMEAIADAYQWPSFRRPQPQLIEDKEPEVIAQVKRIIEEAKVGRLDREQFTTGLANQIERTIGENGEARVALNGFGALKSVALLERRENNGIRQYRYRLTYENDIVLVNCAFNPEGKISGLAFRPE